MEINTHTHFYIQKYKTQTQMQKPATEMCLFSCTEAFMPICTQSLYNLPTPGIGEQGVLGTAPWRKEADMADLSGGPPGAERGTGSVGRATWDKDQTDV